MRILLVALAMTAGLASSVAAQASRGSCFSLEVSDPVWRPSDAAPSPPTSAPPQDSVVHAGPTRFRLDSDGLRRAIGDADLYDLDAESLVPESGWGLRGDTLLVWWGPEWYDTTEGRFSETEGGVWHGHMRRTSDVIVVPDPGEWRYAAVLTELPCGARGAGFSD